MSREETQTMTQVEMASLPGCCHGTWGKCRHRREDLVLERPVCRCDEVKVFLSLTGEDDLLYNLGQNMETLWILLMVRYMLPTR